MSSSKLAGKSSGFGGKGEIGVAGEGRGSVGGPLVGAGVPGKFKSCSGALLG